MELSLEPLTNPDDVAWCAQLMAANDPWITLRRDYDACVAALSQATKERYLVRAHGERAGLLILDMHGTFSGYVQTVCLAKDARGRGLGSRVLAWAEERIFRDSPNVFICVSSFNPGARRLYERLGYQLLGTLTSFIVDEHDELLLRKTRGSWEWFRSRR
jgi:[ribosomal protein S18]-alanine N-acetyltransferase